MNKSPPPHSNLSRILTATNQWLAWRHGSPRRQSSLYQEMSLGAVIGLGALALYAAFADATAPLLTAAAALGAVAGAVIGMLLWCATPGLAQDPVLPPAPGQERQPPRH